MTKQLTSLVVAMAALVSYPALAEEKPESTLTALKSAAAKALGVKLANDDLPEEPPKEPGEPPTFTIPWWCRKLKSFRYRIMSTR